MAVLTPTDLLNMDYSYWGQPFVVGQDLTVSTLNMDYSYWGQPFVTPDYATTPPATNTQGLLILFSVW